MAQAALELLIQLKGDADKQLAGLGGSLRDIATTAAGVFAGGLLTKGFDALTGALAGGIEDARGAAVLFASTEQTIASMGNAAGVSAQHVVDMASSLSDAAGQSNFGDDLIQASTNLLLTFGNLKGETLDAATALTVDLAAALGGEPQSHAMMLGKALNDPVKGLTALGKAGLTFTEEQKAVIAAMVEGGNIAGAQGIIIDELNKQVGGQAKAAADAAGGWVQFNARMGEAAEGIMAGFLPIIDRVAGVLLTNVMPAIEAGVEAFASFAQGILSASDPMAALGAAIDKVLPGFTAVVGFISDNIIPILSGLGAMILAVVIPAFTAWAAAAVPAAIATAVALAPVVAPILAIGAAVALLTVAWQNNWGDIQGKTAAVWAYLQPVFQQLVAWFQQALPVAIAAASQLWTGTLQPALQAVGAFIVGTVIPALGTLANYLADNLPIAIRAASNLWTSTLLPAIQSVASFITGTVIPAISSAASFLATNIPVAIQTASNAFNAIVGVVSSVASAIQGGISAVVTVVQAGWNTVAFVTSAVWNGLASIIGPAISQIVAFISPAISQIQAGWTAGWGAVQQVTASVLGAIQSVVSAGIAFIQSIWSAGTAAVQTQTTSAWGQVQAIIQGVIGVIQSIISTGIAVVQSVMSTAWQVIVAAAQNDFGRIPEIISAGWEQVKGVLSAGIEAIKGIAASMATAAMDLGRSIVSGMIAGVGAMAGALWDKLRGLAGSAIEAAKKAIGYGSPAREFMPLGEAIPQGLIVGIDKGMGALLRTMEGVAKDVIGTTKGLITGVAGAFQDNKLPEAAAAVGRDIIAGWMGGMKDNFSAVKGLAAEMGAETVTALKGSFEIGSPSKLMSREIGIPIVDGITAGINIASPKLSERMLQLGTMLVDLVSKGVDAFGKLRSLGTISMSSITQFADTLQSAMSIFGEMTLRWDKAMMSAASQFTRKSGDVVDLISKGVDMLTKMRGFESIPFEVFRSFSEALEAAILEIVRISTFANRQLLTHAQSFSEGAGKVISIIGTGVDALNKLGTLAQPVAGSFLNFSIQVTALVHRMGQAGEAMAVEVVGAAARFSEGAGKVLGVLGSGIDGLTKLQDLAPPVAGSFLNFSVQVHALVVRMAEMARLMDADAVKAAATFAEGAGKVIAIISGGVDAFVKLQDFQGVSVVAVRYFANAVANIIHELAFIASAFDRDAVAAAGVFSDGVGKVLAIIGTGVEGFTKLVDFQGVSTVAVRYFANAIANVTQELVFIASAFDKDAVAAAGVFSEGVGKAIGIIGAAVDAFNRLRDFEAVPQSAILAFEDTMFRVVEELYQVTEGFTTEALAAAKAFAEAVGAPLGIIGTAVDGFNKLRGFEPVTQGAILAFEDTLYRVVEELYQVTEGFTTEALAAANAFAEAVAKPIGLIGVAVDGFDKLRGFDAVPQAAILAFEDTMFRVVEELVQVTEAFTVEALAAANAFAEAVAKPIGLIGVAVEGFSKLNDFKAVPQAAILAFEDTLYRVVEELVQVTEGFTVEGLAAAQAFAISVTTTIGLIRTALEAFAKLGDFKGLAGGVIEGFTTGLTALLAELQRQVMPASVDTGAQIVAGIIQGVISGQGALADTLIRVVAEAIQGLRTSLGIASPSKIMEQMGAFTMQGLARGITGGTPMVAGAMSTAAGAITNTYDNRTYNVNYTANVPSSGSLHQDLQLLTMLS